VDVVATNPPFGGMEEDGIESNYPAEFRTRETADLFLVLLMKLLKPGGRAGLVLPDGTLFGEGVKTRIKEALLREQDEMKRVAQRLVDENKRLKQYVSTGEQAYAGSMKTAAEAEYEMAKKQFKEAHESFDADALLEAQTKLMQSQMKLEKVNNFRPTPLQDDLEGVETTQTEQPQVRPDEKTLRWQQRNQWFGPDDEMTAVALIAHKQLVHSGIDPRSNEYFAQIDARMRKRFPDFFNEKEEPNTQPTEVRKAATVVAPASRSNGPKKVTLTRTQVAIAKKLGVPLDMYAKQLAQENA
jgi:hypothetical protein